ncbi:FFLEELY motif protein [Leptospira interrogans]|uniref:DUF8198 domain-containing protein n=17 Tax=Leptospira TaxID=171 RepID=A0A1B9FMR5_LEPIR|nr:MULTISPECIES: hypothetical protein [Leptospira]APH42849.1 Uncharacterized protein A9P81_3311 [Leptospira interrogans serovar Copenhageni/Icterohaemorrhagiae]EMM79885.1 hypothetical protein LEP1GSC037_3014 [Leptospira interrogans str. 2006001854]EMN73975.1 hypothetical protein LEP1GSC100_1212 [Leptospira interrogans serovar Bataviae str. UI 08561]KAA1269033.1 hypothetical protein C5473_14420 [Leptospira interrogans serovar Weerasinghe]KAA1291078.1 hypothetical protein C4X99_12450 [Leptospira
MDQQVLELTRKAVVRATIERLRTTYSDLLVVKGYDGIPDFFEFNLYSPSNKEERDNALESLYEKLKTVAGKSMTENIHQIILLNRLTDSLDYDTAKVVIENNLIEDGKISRNNLYAAMGEANRFDERKTQIQMVGNTLKFFFSLSKLPMIKLVMAPIKVAASMVGANSLVETMEAGYELSSKIKDLNPFIDAFLDREIRLITKLETGHPVGELAN